MTTRPDLGAVGEPIFSVKLVMTVTDDLFRARVRACPVLRRRLDATEVWHGLCDERDAVLLSGWDGGEPMPGQVEAFIAYLEELAVPRREFWLRHKRPWIHAPIVAAQRRRPDRASSTPASGPAAAPTERLRTDMFGQVAMRYGARIARELQRRHGSTGDAIERAYAAALGVAVVQPTRVHRITGRVTLLECARGCRATKRITPAGISEYACGKWFTTTELEFAGVGGFWNLLGDTERRPRWFWIRARLIEGRHPGRVRRLLYHEPKTGDGPYFELCPRNWAGLDFDSFDLPAGVNPVDLDAVAALAIARLPEPFRRASCWAQLTSGAGFKPGGRVRLFYVLDKPTSGADLKRWLRGVANLDGSTLNEVTPNYIAAPLFDGVADPVPVRSKLIAGEVDVVEVRIPPAPVRPERPALQPHQAAPLPSWGGVRGAKAYMVKCLRSLADAPAGQGRDACTTVALRLYAICKAGQLDPADATARIKAAMLARGWGADEVTRGQTLADVNRQLEWAWERAEARGLDR